MKNGILKELSDGHRSKRVWAARRRVIGRNAREVGAPTFPEKEAREIIALIRDDETWTGQPPLQRRDGSRFKGAVVCPPLRDGAGELIGVASFICDVTGNGMLQDIRELGRRDSVEPDNE